MSFERRTTVRIRREPSGEHRARNFETATTPFAELASGDAQTLYVE